MSLIFCVVSTGRGRGKTAVIERLTKRFTSQGLKVATVKHITGHFDTAKKDTWRHLEAGATVTIASTPKEIVAITRSKNPTLEKTLEAICIQTELTFVEGYKNSSYPKIFCADSAEDAKSALKGISNVVMISGPISNSAEEREKFETEFREPPVYSLEEMISAVKEMLVNSIVKSLPGLNCKKCGYDSCLDLVQAVLRGEAAIKDCEVQETNITNIIVDGKNIPIGKFPQRIIRGVTLGIIESLKGVKKQPHNVEIMVKANLETTADR
jgi:molybdopterin-guanine dinucleotide biosynthesis protein B